MKLKNAAQATAYCGRSTRVETMVAMEFAASCSAIEKIERQRDDDQRHQQRQCEPNVHCIPARLLHVLDNDAVHHIGDVVETVDNLLQMVVNLVAHEKG